MSLTVAPAATAQEHWTRAFTASLWQPGERDVVTVGNQTLRTQIRVNAGGKAVRVWLGNDFGRMPVRIGKASVRTADGRILPLRFGGRDGTRIAVGASLASDPVAVKIAPFEILEILVYLPEPVTLVGVHDARADKLDISPPGDFSAAEHWNAAATHNLRPLVAGIDVLGPRARPVIVAFGDSITDANSCPNRDPRPCRWSDVLARRLLAAGRPHVVVNQGIGGNTIVAPVTGPSAQARLDRDVLAIPGVTHLLLLEGINDVGKSGDTGVTADELIDGYRQLTRRAQAHGIKVIAMTVTPFAGAGYHTPEREVMRDRLNAWIRSAGIFDGVFDMERVVADPANPKRLRSDLQVGDNLHPNAAGQRAMGEAIPLSLFR
jgi:lysophospholipase L1-like esterase